MVIKLVRHGQSMANTGEVQAAEVGDHTISLTALGHEQARAAGKRIGAAFLDGALAYSSPFRRARQTMAGVIAGAGAPKGSVRVFEDPRLREVEHGYVDTRAQQDLRSTHGWFYYRFKGGESPADCYDRTSAFLEGLMRQAARKNAERVLVVTHSLTIRCFVMRFLHLKVEDFDRMAGLENGAVVTLAKREELVAPVFTSGRWSFRLRLGWPSGFSFLLQAGLHHARKVQAEQDKPALLWRLSAIVGIPLLKLWTTAILGASGTLRACVTGVTFVTNIHQSHGKSGQQPQDASTCPAGVPGADVRLATGPRNPPGGQQPDRRTARGTLSQGNADDLWRTARCRESWRSMATCSSTWRRERILPFSLLEACQKRVLSFKVPPTVVQELAYKATNIHGEPQIRALARKALQGMRGWGITAFDLVSVGHGITEEFAKCLLHRDCFHPRK